MRRQVWLVAALAACPGGGPTLAVRSNGTVALGGDARLAFNATNNASASLDSGITVPVTGRYGAPPAKYVGITVGYYHATSGTLDPGERGVGGAATIGLANYPDDVMGGVSTMAFSGFSGPPCLQGNAHFLFDVTVGVRWVGWFEAYVSPRVNTEGGSCR